MEKFCVFCGNKPNEKNLEHIIPQWLIELTGNLNRVVEFGPVWNTKTLSLEPKEFAFDQFQFPACESCNSKYSLLETKAKNTIRNLIDEKALSGEDFSILLDWFDKIRIGLWLAYNYLQKNIADVNPNYYISQRIGIKDRCIFIYKSDSKERGVTFSGTSVPAFQYQPICFSLRINQYCIFNLSSDFIVSKYLGLPYSREVRFTNGREMEHVLSRGKERVSYPLIRAPYNKKCTEVYQPMFARHTYGGQVDHLYNTDYSRSLFQDFENGVGKILISENSRVVEYPVEPSNIWVPTSVWKLPDLIMVIGKQVLEFQIYFLNRGGKYGNIGMEKKTLIKKQHEDAKLINRFLLKEYDNV